MPEEVHLRLFISNSLCHEVSDEGADRQADRQMSSDRQTRPSVRVPEHIVGVIGGVDLLPRYLGGSVHDTSRGITSNPWYLRGAPPSAPAPPCQPRHTVVSTGGDQDLLQLREFKDTSKRERTFQVDAPTAEVQVDSHTFPLGTEQVIMVSRFSVQPAINDGQMS